MSEVLVVWMGIVVLRVNARQGSVRVLFGIRNCSLTAWERSVIISSGRRESRDRRPQTGVEVWGNLCSASYGAGTASTTGGTDTGWTLFDGGGGYRPVSWVGTGGGSLMPSGRGMGWR